MSSKLRFWLVALAVLVGVLGCQATGGVPSTQPVTASDQLAESIVQEEAQIKLGSGVATTVAILAMDEKDRAEFGRTAYEVARTVNNAVQNDQVKLSDVRDLVAKQLAQSKIKQKEAVSYLLSTVSDLIEARLDSNVFKDVSASAKYRAAKSLLRGASSGVMQATAGYRPVALLNEDMSSYMRWLRPTELYRYG